MGKLFLVSLHERHSPEFWLYTLAACNGELGNPKIVLEEAQEADEIAGKDPVTHPTDGLLPSESVKVQVGGAEPLKAILLCLLPS